jgi:hypothetical protein
MKIGDTINDKDATVAAESGGGGGGTLIEAHADWVSNDATLTSHSANGEPLRVDQVVAAEMHLPNDAGTPRSAGGDDDFYKDFAMGGRTHTEGSTLLGPRTQAPGQAGSTSSSVQSVSIQTEYTIPDAPQNNNGVTILPSSAMGKSNSPLPSPTQWHNNSTNNNNNSHHSSRVVDEAENPTRTTSNKAGVASLRARRRRRQIAFYLILLMGVCSVAGAIFWWWGQSSSTDDDADAGANRNPVSATPNAATTPTTPVAAPALVPAVRPSNNARPPPFVFDDTASRATNIINYINSATYTGQQLVPSNATSASREAQALYWIVYSDPILSETLPNRVDHQVRIRQRYALATLWIMLWASNGGIYDEAWNQEECEWPAIVCVEQAISGANNSSNSSMNVVTEINGPDSEWIGFGSISPDLALLTSLTFFDLSSKDLTGTLPWSIGQWINLITFNVHKNALTGSLHTSIGEWTNLQRFSVYDNALTGTIPTSIAQWSGIQTVLLDTNHLDGTVPEGICQYRSVDLTFLSADCKIECQCCTYCK